MSTLIGFKNIVGVKSSHYLYNESKKNIDIYMNSKKTKDKNINIQVFNTDATIYNDIDYINFFFFFYPFSTKILMKVMNNIEKSLSRNRRLIRIIFIHPDNEVDKVISSYKCLEMKHCIKNNQRAYYENKYASVHLWPHNKKHTYKIRTDLSYYFPI